MKLNFSRLILASCLFWVSGIALASTNVCNLRYSTRNDWVNGFVVDIVVTNSGQAPITEWKAEWRYDAGISIANAPWRANVKINGGSVSATDNGTNPSIPGGSQISFGMALTFTGGIKPTAKDLSITGKNCVVAEAFYADPNSNAASWVRNNGADFRTPAIRDNIANKPAGKWFGDWSGDITKAVGDYVTAAATLKQTPILVAYNIPNRDCGQYSSGGLQSIDGYKNWISAFSRAVGNRKAVLILEPDAIALTDCLSTDGKAARLEMIRYAISQFKENAPNALLYLDAGNSGWISAPEMANRLVQANIIDARGFSLNVSNYITTDSNTAYGDMVNAYLQQRLGITKPFVVDTSRNGNGAYGKEWCDVAGRKLGATSTESLTGMQPEMTLWIKNPGNADGCAASAGTFVPQIAYNLIYGYS